VTTTNPYWPLPSPDSLGTLVGADDVRNAVKRTITEWSPYYLAIVSERLVDEGIIGGPNQQSAPLDNFGKWDREPINRSIGTGQPAAFLVTSPGTIGAPTLQGNRQYRATYRAIVTIFVFGTTWEQCSDRTSWYEKATRMSVLNNRGLYGLATGTKWLGSVPEALEHDSTRTLGQCKLTFDVAVPIAAEIRGPASVPVPPVAPPQDPTVETTAVTLNLVPDTEALEVEED
jgi:hypothetical protein